MNDIDMAQKALHQSWRKVLQHTATLKAAPNDVAMLRVNLAETQTALQSYRGEWSRLEQLYEKDKTGETTEERVKSEVVVLENTDMANNIKQSSERVYQLT